MIQCMIRYGVVLAVLGAGVIGGGAGYLLGFSHGYDKQLMDVQQWNSAVWQAHDQGVERGRKIQHEASLKKPIPPVSLTDRSSSLRVAN